MVLVIVNSKRIKAITDMHSTMLLHINLRLNPEEMPQNFDFYYHCPY